MSRLLYLQASPRGERSVSNAIADAFVSACLRKNPGDTVKKLNVYQADLPHFDGYALAAKYAVLNGVSHSRDEQAAWARVAALAQEFASHDKYVIASPMWNFSIPYRLKQYLDLIVQPTLTFRFSPEEGYRGLVTGKPVCLALARGGEYPAGSPGEAWDFQLRYLKTILGFIGFTDIRVVIAEPTLGAPETTGARRAAALEQAATMGAEF